MNVPDLVELPCKDSVALTISRLESLIKAQGLKVHRSASVCRQLTRKDKRYGKKN